MLGVIEFIFSLIGIYGIFSNNIICVIIGLIAIIIGDFIDIFITGHNPTRILFMCLLATVISVYNKNPLFSFTIALCGENLVMTLFTMVLILISSIGIWKKK